MAYIREQQIKRGDKTYHYYQLVRGYRENGKVKIEVLKHLGRFDSKAEAQAAAGVVTKSNQVPTRAMEEKYPYVWYWREQARPALGDRKGQRCRVLARGKMNSAMVEFEPDGFKTITSRNALRKARGT